MLKRKMRQYWFLAFVFLLHVFSAHAGDYENAYTAYKAGDFDTAYSILKPLAEQGDAEAQNYLGFIYEKGEGVQQNNTEAAKWYRRAAEQGYTIAQNNLGLMYESGNGVEQNKSEAVKWYRKAAEQGDATAQYNLGYMYNNGEGIPKNSAEAVRWFRKAAEQGLALAQVNLGTIYSNGKSVQQNKAEAARWYKKAAEQGDTDAQLSLGRMYYNGEGVPKADVFAYAWWNIAAAQGNEEAKNNRDLISRKMTPSQIEQGQLLSQQFTNLITKNVNIINGNFESIDNAANKTNEECERLRGLKNKYLNEYNHAQARYEDELSRYRLWQTFMDSEIKQLKSPPDKTDMVSARAFLDETRYEFDRKCLEIN